MSVWHRPADRIPLSRTPSPRPCGSALLDDDRVSRPNPATPVFSSVCHPPLGRLALGRPGFGVLASVIVAIARPWRTADDSGQISWGAAPRSNGATIMVQDASCAERIERPRRPPSLCRSGLEFAAADEAAKRSKPRRWTATSANAVDRQRPPATFLLRLPDNDSGDDTPPAGWKPAGRRHLRNSSRDI